LPTSLPGVTIGQESRRSLKNEEAALKAQLENGQRYLLHDRDATLCVSFDSLLKAAGVKALKLPSQSESKGVYRTLGPLCERRVPIQTDSVW